MDIMEGEVQKPILLVIPMESLPIEMGLVQSFIRF